MAVKSKYLGWNLYWVYSDGLEDCFVVARNIRSAIKVERDMNGFEPDDVGALHVCRISQTIARSQFPKGEGRREWPWYGHEPLLKRLGAERREINGREEVLLNDVVYSQGVAPRIIGGRFCREFKRSGMASYFEGETKFTRSQEALYTLMGVCLARCQEIEKCISWSFVLGVNAKDKVKYKTISDMAAGWERKTFGGLIRSIEESYVLEAQFKEALGLFLEWRNRLVHGLVVQEQYDINTTWGQDETVAFLVRFEFVSRAVRVAFRSAYWFSIEFANDNLLRASEDKIKLNRKQRGESALFPHFFKLAD